MQAARVCEVVEYLRHTGDPDGNLWNISLRDTAWLGNIYVSQSGAAWTSLIMHQSQFENLRFIDGAIDLDRGFWQDQMKGMYAEVDHLNGLRGDSLHALVQVKPGADGGLLSLQQHQDIDTVRLQYNLRQMVKTALGMRPNSLIKINTRFLTRTKKRISVVYCEDREAVKEAKQLMDTIYRNTQAPPQLRFVDNEYRMVDWDTAAAAENHVQDAVEHRWAQEDEDTQGRRLMLMGIDFEPMPSAVVRLLADHNVVTVPTVTLTVTKSYWPHKQTGVDLWIAYFTVMTDAMASWMVARASTIIYGDSELACKAVQPREARSVRQVLKQEAGPNGRYSTHGPTDGLTRQQLEALTAQLKTMTAAQVRADCVDLFNHWVKEGRGADIDPNSPSAALYAGLTSRMDRVEAQVGTLQDDVRTIGGTVAAVTVTAEGAVTGLKLVEARCNAMQQQHTVTASDLDKTEGKVAMMARSVERMQNQLDILTLQASEPPAQGLPKLDNDSQGSKLGDDSDTDSDENGDVRMRSSSPQREKDVVVEQIMRQASGRQQRSPTDQQHQRQRPQQQQQLTQQHQPPQLSPPAPRQQQQQSQHQQPPAQQQQQAQRQQQVQRQQQL